MKLPFVGGSYEGRSSNVSPETCLNLFYEKTNSGESLVGTAGSTLLVTPKQGEVRGGIAYNNLAYFVVGDTLYEINSAGTATSRGTLLTSSGKVSMAHNGWGVNAQTNGNQEIFIADGPYGYIYDNTTSTLAQITDTDFTTSKTVTFIDGYFIFNQNDSSGRFWLTQLYSGTSILTGDLSTAEGNPDPLQAVLADNRLLFLFGEESLEVWWNSGDLDNTFQRYQGGFKQHGCVAAHSPARFDNTVVWLSRNDRGDGQVVMMGEGYMPRVISPPELNHEISTYKNLEQAFAYSYQHEGHEFYVITFPGNAATWAYDASTQQWHRRSHIINDIDSRERYSCHVFAFGEHLFGDMLNGGIYKLDGSIGTFNSARVHRQRRTQPIADEEGKVRIASVQLDMEEGLGSGSEANDDQFWLSVSKNGGHTYGNSIMKNAGEGGDWARRVIWRKLGEARNWIFQTDTWTSKRPVLKGLIAKLYGE